MKKKFSLFASVRGWGAKGDDLWRRHDSGLPWTGIRSPLRNALPQKSRSKSETVWNLGGRCQSYQLRRIKIFKVPSLIELQLKPLYTDIVVDIQP